MREFKSKVLKSVSTSSSVRATIPETVATILGAEPGDILVWTADAHAGTATVRIHKAKRKRPNAK